MILMLLEEAAKPANSWTQYILLAVLVVIFGVGFWWSSRSNKKRQAKEEAKLNAVGPGNKVKTIGGICGIVVSVDAEEKTFVLETGDEEHGKCFIKFDRQAIYQTDAVAEEPAKADKKSETAEEVIAQAEAKAEEETKAE
ncbi:MAG: preprotein translocase subunit YajC [Clostridia bacterium]|nr:preprotein translocase subunit YajC [Clostridia bacterium]